MGRDDELGLLDTALSGVCAGAGLVVVLSGPPGIGKSTVLHEVTARATGAGVRVVTGAATEFGDAPFAGLAAALRPIVADLGEADRRRLGPELLAELHWAEPTAAGRVRALGDERYRTARAVAAVLGHVAARQPLLLALDDAHWADQATAEVVAHLLRRRVPGMLLALAHRTGQLATPLRRALVPIDGDVRIELGPLPRGAADTLLGAGLPAAQRAELYDTSGGNPFYLLELVRHRVRQDGEPIPTVVLAALRSEIAALPEPVRELAQGAAVAGEPFDPVLAAPAAGLSIDDALESIDALVAVDLVTVTDDPRRFRFRHPLIRQAVYELAGADWRGAAHHRLAVALAVQGAPAVDRAPHVAASALPGDADAVRLLTEAGTAVLARSPDTAARWYRSALELSGPEPAARTGLLLLLAKALGTSGRLVQARAALSEAAALLPPGPDLADVLTLAANLDHLLGHHDTARAMLGDALAALPDQRSPSAARLLLALASVGMHTCDHRGMRATAAEAMAIARSGDDLSLRAIAAATLAVAEYHVADVPAARAACDEATDLVAGLAGRALSRRVDAVAWLGWAQWFVERYAAAEATFTRGRDVTRAHGLGFVLAELQAGLACTLLSRGRIAEAATEADDARAAAELTGARLALAMAVMTQAEAALVRGEHVVARKEAEEAMEALGPTDLAGRLLCGPVLAEARLATGDAELATDELLATGGGPGLGLVERTWQPRWYEILTRAALARGDVDEAAGWAERAATAAAGCGLAGRTGAARRARAAVLLARGDAVRAAEAAAESAALFDEAGCPLEVAHARVLTGRAHGAAGHLDDAVRELRAAESVAGELGADDLRVTAARALRELGRRPLRALTGLSGREREVAELAATGLSDHEIAAVLVVSKHTVAGHLARARTKLGVRSRAALVEALSADPLDPLG